jgi:cytochrome P450
LSNHDSRRLVGAAFSPKVVTGLAPRIAEVTRELLDATGGAREFDLVTALAYPLPVTVIAELLGLPISDRELFRAWADRLFGQQVAEPNDPDLAQKVDDATADMRAYLHEHCQDRRVNPRQDLISALASVQLDGERFTDEEVVNFSMVLLFAGHITTTALLGNTVLCLDERKFTDPDQFDIHRAANHHVAFGHGIHFCIGQLLARVKGRVAVSVLLDRYADIRLNANVPLTFYGRGIFAAKNVPVTVRPA